MDANNAQSTSSPVDSQPVDQLAPGGSRTLPFDRCPRCRYSLRGLPANHFCPECGLEYDENCVAAKVRNPKRVLLQIVFLVVMVGYMFAVSPPSLGPWDAESGEAAKQLVGCVGLLVACVLGCRSAMQLYRSGPGAAVASEGVIARLPDVPRELIPWSRIVEVRVIVPENGRGVGVQLVLRDRKPPIYLGGKRLRLFATTEEAERFANAIYKRATAAGVDVEYARSEANR
jgi:hypothetical protein